MQSWFKPTSSIKHLSTSVSSQSYIIVHLKIYYFSNFTYQNIGRFDVAVYDFELVFQVVKGADYTGSNLTNIGLWNDVTFNAINEFVKFVQTDVHEFHTNPAVAFLKS